uniref:Uncharacterized protein n=1 Tax=Rodentolepis nana TaxID=102285 RepID=A0A0R3TQ45_RODNA
MLCPYFTLFCKENEKTFLAFLWEQNLVKVVGIVIATIWMGGEIGLLLGDLCPVVLTFRQNEASYIQAGQFYGLHKFLGCKCSPDLALNINFY